MHKDNKIVPTFSSLCFHGPSLKGSCFCSGMTYKRPDSVQRLNSLNNLTRRSKTGLLWTAQWPSSTIPPAPLRRCPPRSPHISDLIWTHTVSPFAGLSGVMVAHFLHRVLCVKLSDVWGFGCSVTAGLHLWFDESVWLKRQKNRTGFLRLLWRCLLIRHEFIQFCKTRTKSYWSIRPSYLFSLFQM